jgi:hypothetical protein
VSASGAGANNRETDAIHARASPCFEVCETALPVTVRVWRQPQRGHRQLRVKAWERPHWTPFEGQTAQPDYLRSCLKCWM